MTEIISRPLYDSLSLPEHIAWPESDDDAYELARRLTGRECEYIELDDDMPSYGPCDMVACIDGTEYLVSYVIKGTYHNRHANGSDMGQMYAVIGSVHLIRRGAAHGSA